MRSFEKQIGDFNMLTVKHLYDETIEISMRAGFTDKYEKVQIRGDEAVRDLHYALTRYLDMVEKEK